MLCRLLFLVAASVPVLALHDPVLHNSILSGKFERDDTQTAFALNVSSCSGKSEYTPHNASSDLENRIFFKLPTEHENGAHRAAESRGTRL